MFACGGLSSSPELPPILKILATPLNIKFYYRDWLKAQNELNNYINY